MFMGHGSVVVDILFIAALIDCIFVYGSCFVMQYFLSFLVLFTNTNTLLTHFCNCLVEEKRADCFTSIVFLMSCDC